MGKSIDINFLGQELRLFKPDPDRELYLLLTPPAGGIEITAETLENDSSKYAGEAKKMLKKGLPSGIFQDDLTSWLESIQVLSLVLLDEEDKAGRHVFLMNTDLVLTLNDVSPKPSPEAWFQAKQVKAQFMNDPSQSKKLDRTLQEALNSYARRKKEEVKGQMPGQFPRKIRLPGNNKIQNITNQTIYWITRIFEALEDEGQLSTEEFEFIQKLLKTAEEQVKEAPQFDALIKTAKFSFQAAGSPIKDYKGLNQVMNPFKDSTGYQAAFLLIAFRKFYPLDWAAVTQAEIQWLKKSIDPFQKAKDFKKPLADLHALVAKHITPPLGNSVDLSELKETYYHKISLLSMGSEALT